MAEEKNKEQGPAAPAKSKLKAAEQPEEGTVVGIQKVSWDGKPQENYMWVEGTGASKHFPKGQKHEVHIISGQKLISKGAAVETKAPAKPKAPVKKVKDDEED